MEKQFNYYNHNARKIIIIIIELLQPSYLIKDILAALTIKTNQSA